MIKVFTVNKNGKIELTEKELKKLLDEVYWEGYRDNNKTWTYTSPLTYPYYTYTTATSTNTIDANTTSSPYTINGSSITSGTITLGKE